MRLFIALMLVLAAVAALPSVEAHQCNGGYKTCGDCVKGEAHNHNDSNGQCSSGPGYYTSNGYGGQTADIPGVGLLGVLMVGAIGAVVLARR